MIERVFPWTHCALVRHLVSFLCSDDTLHLAQTHRICFGAVRAVIRDFQHRTARLALALWCMRSLRIEFQSHYQELETQRIARSQTNDPRVPPRVVPIWSERGKVEGGVVTLEPSSLPLVHCDGVTAQFAVAADGATPMLTNAVQTQRRIYTMVTVKLLRRRLPSTERSANNDTHTRTSRTNGRDDDSEADGAVVLRQYSYIKEFHEWIAPPAGLKQRLDRLGHAPCRIDLHTQDGSLALELDVPSGADSLLDYYLVKRAVVNIHMDELLERFFATLRPPQPLPIAGADRLVDCVLSLHFRTLRGKAIGAYDVPAQLSIERPTGSATTGTRDGSSVSREPRATGTEHFDIVTCKAQSPIAANVVKLPRTPGYVWLRIRSTQSRQSYFHAVALHHGAVVAADERLATLHTRWLPGVLESFPTLDSRQRRCLKGHVTIIYAVESGALQELTVMAQYLDTARLTRYAASVHSYARIEATD